MRRWTRADKILIVEAREMQGYFWTTIAEMFPGATAKQCANKYYWFRQQNPDLDIESEVVPL